MKFLNLFLLIVAMIFLSSCEDDPLLEPDIDNISNSGGSYGKMILYDNHTYKKEEANCNPEVF